MRAQRSNPGSVRGEALDCFAALAMTAHEETVSPNCLTPANPCVIWITLLATVIPITDQASNAI
ncbi:hypothetical protein EAS56_18290 [Bradyrhizobium guangzhouense]|uniref:Uncharacterized protein n=1 Tax=Bradyrhizobium guangzhouense TaxID=1325095 RepID=A0ABY0E4G1_9BRAD|nr:hypothetical protein EAS56_18290 [Bradyrhizobium guangzhouense]